MGTHKYSGKGYYNGDVSAAYCDVCGYVHLVDVPDNDDVNKYYEEDKFYATHSPVGWFDKEIRENEDGLWNSYYGFLSNLIIRNTNAIPSILDIGCGCGWFVRYWNRRYCNAIGIDPSKSARDIAREYGSIVVDTIPDKKFDAVLLSLVLEHVPNPLESLIEVNDMLNDDGIVIVVVPNEFNPLQSIVAKDYGKDWFVQKPHINYFSKQTAIDIVKKAGFDIIETHSTFPMELMYIIGHKYIGNDVVGKKCHEFRLGFEKKFPKMAWKLYGAMNKISWGREIIVVGRK